VTAVHTRSPTEAAMMAAAAGCAFDFDSIFDSLIRWPVNFGA
jgi:hypothetical protein